MRVLRNAILAAMVLFPLSVALVAPASAATRAPAVAASAANGNLYGPYNASPQGGANFESDTESVRQTTIAITLTTPNGDVLCAQDYYA